MWSLQASCGSKLSKARATAFPPLVGRGQGGGIAEPPLSGFPPPLTPPHEGEGNPVAAAARDCATVMGTTVDAVPHAWLTTCPVPVSNSSPPEAPGPWLRPQR